MPTITDFPAIGRIIAVDSDTVTFNPIDTNYELRLLAAGGYAGPLNERIQCHIRAVARKIYTVPSGGNFISPIFGPPRTIQGRVKFLDETTAVVHAGTPIIIDLPQSDSARDLACGPLAVGAIVNVVALPGARLELIGMH